MGDVGLEQLVDEIDFDRHVGPERQGLPEQRQGVLVQRLVLGLLVAVAQQEGHADEEHQHHLLHRRRQLAVLVRARAPATHPDTFVGSVSGHLSTLTSAVALRKC